jgi:hypothetical protein
MTGPERRVAPLPLEHSCPELGVLEVISVGGLNFKFPA